MKKFYITGVAGTGKSTVSKELNRRGVASFDIDVVPGLCHWVNKQTKEHAEYPTQVEKVWIENHEWICDKEKLRQYMDTFKDTVVVVGVCFNQKEYLDIFDKIFFLKCSESSLRHRLNTREENDFGKDPVQQEAVMEWHRDKSFEDKLVKRGAIPIDSEGTVAEVADRIISQF